MKTKLKNTLLVLLSCGACGLAKAQYVVTDLETHINQQLELGKWAAQIDQATKAVQTANNTLAEARHLNQIKGDPSQLTWGVMDTLGQNGQLTALAENRQSLDTIVSNAKGAQAFTDSTLRLASAADQTMNIAGQPVQRNSDLYKDIAAVAAANRELDAAQRLRNDVQKSENVLEQDLLQKLANAPSENEKKMITEQLLALRERRKRLDDEVNARKQIRDQIVQEQDTQKKMQETMADEAMQAQMNASQTALLQPNDKPVAPPIQMTPGNYKGASDYIH